MSAILLQATVFSLISYPGVRPDLVTVIAIATGLQFGLMPGSATGFIGGFLMDYFTGRLIGVGAVSKMLIGGLAGWVAPKIFSDYIVVPPLAVLLGSILEQAIYLLLADAFGLHLPLWPSFVGTALPVAVYNVVFTFPIYCGLIAADRKIVQWRAPR